MLEPASDELENPTPTPRQLILKLLLVVEGGELDVTSAVRACALFGLSANNTRVALARLQSAELIETVVRGAYRLGQAGRALGEEIGAWRQAETRLREWDGSWVVALTAALGRSDRKALRARERAFGLVGLRELDDGLFIRPDNLVGGVAHTRERLLSLGVENSTAVFQAQQFDPQRDARARLLWDASELQKTYSNGQRTLQASMARLAGMPIEDAARESYVLGDQAMRQIVFDPMLPEPLVDSAHRRSFRELVKQYDDVGHQIWRDFLAQGR